MLWIIRFRSFQERGIITMVIIYGDGFFSKKALF